MANKIIQLKDGNDNLYPTEPQRTGTLTASSGMTISELRINQTGKVVEVHFYATKSSAFGSDQVLIGTISGVNLPPDNIRTICGTGTFGWNGNHCAYAVLDSVGKISILASTTTDTVANIDFVYTVN